MATRSTATILSDTPEYDADSAPPLRRQDLVKEFLIDTDCDAGGPARVHAVSGSTSASPGARPSVSSASQLAC